MTTTNKQVILLDASALKQSACMLRLYRTLIEGYRSERNGISLVFGSCIHKFIEQMRQTGGDYSISLAAAITMLKESNAICTNKRSEWMMQPQSLMAACMHYWEHWARHKDELKTVVIDSKPLVELKFCYPYYQDDMFEVNLAGTIDDVARMGTNGLYVIRDYKTTSSWDKHDYLAKYKLSPQLKFYYFAIQQYAQMYPDSIYAEIVKAKFGCMIEGIFLNPDSTKIEIHRSELFTFKSAELVEFKELLDSTITRLLQHLRIGKLPAREGTVNGACSAEFGCPYSIVCMAPDDIARKHILNNNFITKTYNPLQF